DCIAFKIFKFLAICVFMCFLSNETIRRKWKGLRDTYVREKKKETEKKSGSGASQGKKWKYFAVLSFLDPFITPRETNSNMGWGVEENGTVEYSTEVTLPGRSEDTAAGPLESEMGEDELFFQSLLPSLQRLPPQQKELVKFQIHKLIYESSTVTLNLEPTEGW
uniref:BESS domain-containing protein n=1 Tax=Sinocyclocheilus grahami TaxID=75366 RepID=A0A672K732_SINGR